MMKTKITKLFLAGGLLTASSLFGAAICPTTSSTTGTDASGCSLLITFGSAGTTITTTDIGPYDGIEDVTVGVINNTSNPLSSITLNSSSGTDAFGFESDGIQTFTSINGVAIGTGGGTTYEGPNSTFDMSGVVGGDGTLVIRFAPAIGAGGSDYFSLEGTPAIGGGITVGGGGGNPGGVPEPANLMMLGTALGAVGLLIRRRRAKQ
jgi:hypothetical protein